LNALDWVIVAVVLLLALQGWRAGLIGSVFSLAGFIAGAWLAAKFAPKLLPEGRQSPYAPLFALVGAVAGGVTLAMLMEAIGERTRKLLPIPFLGAIDGAFGAVLGFFIGLGCVWLLGLTLIKIPAADSLRGELRSSKVLSALNSVLPSSDTVLGLFSNIDPLPAVGGPSTAGVGDLPAGSQLSGVNAAYRSVVRVRAQACGFGLEGSGWVSGPDTIVTNAHVVAGDQAPTVEVPGSNSRAAARVVVFDQTNDIAVLKVSGLNARPLVISGETSLGLPAAVIGYPLDGPLSASPARVGGTVAVLTDDAYGRGPMLRTIVVLRALVRPGNSGGPVVDRNGQLLAMVYAKTNGSGSPGGYAVPPSMIEKSLQRATSGAHDQVGPCIG